MPAVELKVKIAVMAIPLKRTPKVVALRQGFPVCTLALVVEMDCGWG